MNNAATQTPRQIDEALAAKWHEIAKAEQQVAYTASTLLHLAGAKYYYRGRQRVTDMTLAEAVAKMTAAAEYIAAYKAEHGYVERESFTAPNGNTVEYDYHGTNWDAFDRTASQGILEREADEPAEYLAKLAERKATLARLRAEADKIDEQYTGWSRFFLVTSSAGHVHSSTCCSTCKPTTTYGWLPALSGKDEQTAVKELGPTLCSVCFPSAPTEWTTGKKITAAQAAKKAA